MLKHLLNDSAILKSVQGFDEYDQPSFSQIKTINCRMEFSLYLQNSTLSSSVASSAKMFCIDEIKTGDIVSYNSFDYKVSKVNIFADLDGQTVLKEVYLI